MFNKFMCVCMAILLSVSVLSPAAMASGEAEEVTAEQTEETAQPAESSAEATVEAPAETAEPMEAEEPAEEPAEEAAEEAAEESVSDRLVELYPDADPEDPLYEKYMGLMTLSLDGGSTTFSDYSPRSVAGEEVLKGIDVSAWQGTIDWTRVAASGVEFVFIRAAYRTTGSGVIATDSMFKTYINGARAAGLKVGVYIYSQAITAAEGREEAQYLMNLVSGYTLDLPLVIDYEYYGTSGRLYNANLSRRAATDVCNAFCAETEKYGYEGIVYANPYMLNNKLYPDEFESVWLAHYTTRTTYSGDYDFWQCSGTGAVNGVSGDVDLDFWFKPQKTEADPFSDVASGSWYYDCVMQAHENGIVDGVGGGSFAPNSTATRGQVVTMLYRVQGEPTGSADSAFTDLTQDYYKKAVAWAAANGVTTGYSDQTFGPDGLITRQDLVTMLYRLTGLPSVTGSLDAYGDSASVSSYAQSAMLWAVGEGIITGYEDSTLRPKNSATRAEVCAILMRFAAKTA